MSGPKRAYTFPFDIRFVTSQMGLTERRRNDSHMYVDCFLCANGKKAKMNIDFGKDTYRCNYCQAQGGMLDLYAKWRGTDTRIAYRELLDRWNNGQTDLQAAPTSPKSPRPTTAAMADIETRHETYSALLDSLELYPHHRKNLHERGLSDAQIAWLGYKSVPTSEFGYGCENLAARLLAAGHVLLGVPGCYVNSQKGRWNLNLWPKSGGILYPSRTLHRKIQACQIRLDRPIDGVSRHLWFSSAGKQLGTGSGSPLHFVGQPGDAVVYATEGAMKSDIAHMLSGKTFCAAPSASQETGWREWLEEIWNSGSRTLVEAYDIDKKKNIKVLCGAFKMLMLAQEQGFETHRIEWNPAFKGVDDRELERRNRLERLEYEHTIARVPGA